MTTVGIEKTTRLRKTEGEEGRERAIGNRGREGGLKGEIIQGVQGNAAEEQSDHGMESLGCWRRCFVY